MLHESVYQTYATTHVYALSGLINNTMYYYLINGTDIYGNYYTSARKNQTTLQTTTALPTTQTGCSEAMASIVTSIETIVTFLSLIITVVMLGFIIGVVTGFVNLEAIQADEQSAMGLYIFVVGFVFVAIMIAVGLVIISTFGGAC